VVQHRLPTHMEALAGLLDDLCPLHVKEAEEKERICPGNIYIAPGNYHLLVERDRTMSLSVDEKVSYARPAIDVLFETAAETYRASLIGILLTGANHDGTRGLKKIKENGGLTIVQDPDTAEAAAMPRSAIEAHAASQVLPLPAIAAWLQELGVKEK
jgi:two-component system, chemotaxis family, protein-glutamate methylesterase/glutaminase